MLFRSLKVNFCTFNPLYRDDSSDIRYSNGNTTVSNVDTVWESTYGTLGFTKGKFYWELKIEALNSSNGYANAGIIEGIVEKIGFRSTTIRKFDKSLAIIPNFQFAENAVVNVSETSNWLISWIITLQYDTTVDQLKIIRNEIENHINTSDNYDTSVGVAVRIDKFSDSSIDMYVRCFTKTSSWNDWLTVKENLAINIKQIVEKNGASFAFPSQSIYVEKK